MATFPPITTPTPDQWMRAFTRQVLAGPATLLNIPIGSSAFTYRSLWIDLHIVKDGTAGGIQFGMNSSGGSVDYIQDQTSGVTIINSFSAVGQPSILLLAGASIAANRDGSWSIWIAQGPPNDVVIIGTGGFFKNTTAIQCVSDIFAIQAMGGAQLGLIQIVSLAGNLAANTAIAVTGEYH